MKTFIIFLAVCLNLLNYSIYGQINSNVTPALELYKKFSNLRDFTISLDGKEAYTTVQSTLGEVSVIVRLSNKNNKWSSPKIASFSGKFSDMEAFLSPDNLILYFVSNRPINYSLNQPKDYDIWYVERKDKISKWGTPQNMGSPINTPNDEFFPSIAKNGNLYFTTNKNPNSKGKDDIYCCKWIDNMYSPPINQGDSVNTAGYEFNSYISSNESYLIFSGYNRKDGFGSGDLYISYKIDSLHWSKAHNLGSGINSKYMDYCPFVDSLLGLLYFTSRRSSLKKYNNFKSLEELEKELSKAENGLSRIYKVKMDKKWLIDRKQL